MLFVNGTLQPDLIPDRRTRDLVAKALTMNGGVLRPADFVAASFSLRQPEIHTILLESLLPGTTPESVLENWIQCEPRNVLTRDDFSANALRAIEEFQTVLLGSGGVLMPVAVELLLHCMLKHCEPADEQKLRDVDVRRTVGVLHACILRQMDPRRPSSGKRSNAKDPRETTVTNPPSFRLPVQLAPSEDLTERASYSAPALEHPFDTAPLYAPVFEAIVRGLHRRSGGHILLVGERGVGKTTIVAELARRIVQKRYRFLADHHLLRIDCRHIPADESRQRLEAIFARIAEDASLIACFEGFHALFGSNQVSNGSALLSHLAQTRCRVVGLLTMQEYETCIADNYELGEVFTRIDVPEPDPATALCLLEHYAMSLEREFDLKIEPEAIHQSVTLTANYILNDQLPAKALKVLHRACEEYDYNRSQPGHIDTRIGVGNVYRIVSSICGIPQETLEGIAGQVDYEVGLREIILGQDEAIRDVSSELGLIKAGMTDPNKPASVMLFLGQTGTGKTEMAKTIARFYSASKRLRVYPLGNCVEPHSVATIIGVPPGYVGHDKGGRLVNELISDPYCVFLLDEADKAHPDVLQPFLNLFDEGWVSDQRGVRGYADRAIFIMTTNVGQKLIADMTDQGKTLDEIAARMKEALSQIRHHKSDRPVFTPEFLARIRRVIVFRPLDSAAMIGIARKLLSDLVCNWSEKRGKRLTLPERFGELLGEQAHRSNLQSKGKEGGRIVRKLLADWLESPLQREISHNAEAYRQCSLITIEMSDPMSWESAACTTGPPLKIAFSMD